MHCAALTAQRRRAQTAQWLDRIIACGLLVALAPGMALIAFAIRLDSSGPVLHRALRAGLGGAPFTLFKFRTMVTGAEREGPGITAAGDPRVTRVGRLLRRTKLDELAQLWNVVRGDMRLVGPRPEDPRFVAAYHSDELVALSVYPGITGPSQLIFFNEESVLAGMDVEASYLQYVLPRKIATDVEYALRRSLLGDCRIILATICLAARSLVGRNPAGLDPFPARERA